MFALGWTEEWIFLTTWFVVILYTTQGGFLAVVWTDLLQATLMIGILLVAFAFAQINGPSLPEAVSYTQIGWGHFEPKLLGLLVMPFLFMFIEQDMVQRCFAGKNQKAVTKGALFASLVLFVLAIIPVYFGLLGKSYGLQASIGSKFMQAIELSTNSFVYSCASCAVLLAVVSTASSLLSAISSNIASDFMGLSKPRLITFTTGIIALLASKFSSNIFEWMIASYELAVDSLFVPLVLAVFLKERCHKLKLAAQLSTLLGCVGFIGTKLFAHQFLSLFLPLFMSLIGYALGALITKRVHTPSYETN